MNGSAKTHYHHDHHCREAKRKPSYRGREKQQHIIFSAFPLCLCMACAVKTHTSPYAMRQHLPTLQPIPPSPMLRLIHRHVIPPCHAHSLNYLTVCPHDASRTPSLGERHPTTSQLPWPICRSAAPALRTKPGQAQDRELARRQMPAWLKAPRSEFRIFSPFSPSPPSSERHVQPSSAAQQQQSTS